MLQTKFQASEASDSERENFLKLFSCFSVVQAKDPQGKGGFGPKSHYLNKPCQGLLATATYRISST